jgi:hypothetical protein
MLITILRVMRWVSSCDPHCKFIECLPQLRLWHLTFAYSVDGAPVGANESRKFPSRQVIQGGHDLLVKMVAVWVVVFGDDFV